MELSANNTSGIAPLQVYFSVTTTNITPVSYQMDFEGNGVVDYTGTTFEDINHTYTTEGIYYPKITVIDNFGNAYSDSIAIIVLNSADLDSLLRGKWTSMINSLATGDTTRALTYISSATKTPYQEMFNALTGQLPSIVATQTEFNLISIKRSAEYKLVTLENGTKYSYEVIFIKDNNGIWMIMEF